MQSLSVFRGQGVEGIGEGDGVPVSLGEQYLAADGELRSDRDFLNQARSWLTLDARNQDHSKLQKQLEAWSVTRVAGRSVVARMVTNPHFEKYDKRPAYFTHGRVGVDPANDAGLALGRGDLFDAPWPDGRRVAQPQELNSDLSGIEQAKAEPAMVLQLTAHLLQALLDDQLIVLGLELEEFRAGSKLPPLVSFARACLPTNLRDACNLRLFTRNPSIFGSSCRLIAVPDEIAGHALGAHRSSVLLDRQGQKHHGPDLSPDIYAYARAVVARALQMPAGLLAYNNDVTRFFTPPAHPPERLTDSVVMLYNASYAGANPEHISDMMKKGIVPKLDSGQLLPMHEILPPRPHRIWTQVPLELLAWLVLSDDLPALCLEHQDDSAKAQLRRLATKELRERGALVDAQLGERATWSPTDLAHLAWLQTYGLVSKPAAASVSATANIKGLPPFGPSLTCLLQIETETTDLEGRPIISRRDGEQEALAALGLEELDQGGSALLTLLLEQTIAGALDGTWLLLVAQRMASQHITRLAPLVLERYRSEQGDHAQQAVDLILKTLEEQREPLLSMVDVLIRLLRTTRPDHRLERFLIINELLQRSGADQQAYVGPRLLQVCASIADRQQRQSFVAWAQHPDRSVLSVDDLILDGNLALPASWLADVVPQLAHTPELEPKLSTDGVLTVWSQLASDHPALPAYHARIDRIMGETGSELTDKLLHFDSWERWRVATTLRDDALRDASVHWLSSGLWSNPQPPRATRRQWISVIEGLKPRHEAGTPIAGFRVQDMQRCARFDPSYRRDRPSWPWITPYQDQQLVDLCRCTVDLEILDLMARVIDPQLELGHPIPDLRKLLIESSPFSELRDPSILEVFSNPEELPPVSLDILHDIPLLLRTCGREDERVERAVSRWVAQGFSLDTGAAQQLADQLARWEQSFFVEAFGTWFRANEAWSMQPPLPDVTVAAFDKALRTIEIRYRPKRPPPEHQEAALRYWKAERYEIARHLYPLIDDDKRVLSVGNARMDRRFFGTRLEGQAVQWLMNHEGWRNYDFWQDLNKRCQWANEEKPAKYRHEHPLLAMADLLRQKALLLRPDELDSLLRRGSANWSQVIALPRYPNLLDVNRLSKGILPAMDVFAALGGYQPDQAALAIIRAQPSKWTHPGWWEQLFESIDSFHERWLLKNIQTRLDGNVDYTNRIYHELQGRITDTDARHALEDAWIAYYDRSVELAQSLPTAS